MHILFQNIFPGQGQKNFPRLATPPSIYLLLPPYPWITRCCLFLCTDFKAIMEIDDTAKGGLTHILGTFYRDSLRAQRFQTLLTSLFEDIWVSNLIGGLSKGRGSLHVKFSFLRHETTKLGPQRIVVQSSEVS